MCTRCRQSQTTPWSHLLIFRSLCSPCLLSVGRTGYLISNQQNKAKGMDVIASITLHHVRLCLTGGLSLSPKLSLSLPLSLSFHSWLWGDKLPWILQLQSFPPATMSSMNFYLNWSPHVWLDMNSANSPRSLKWIVPQSSLWLRTQLQLTLWLWPWDRF